MGDEHITDLWLEYQRLDGTDNAPHREDVEIEKAYWSDWAGALDEV